jgi:hypothetical protein
MELGKGSGTMPSSVADNALLFCYRLRDGYHIVRSKSSLGKGKSFSFLNELLYQLESRPDEALRSEEWKSMLETLLRDLASGALEVEANTGRTARP